MPGGQGTGPAYALVGVFFLGFLRGIFTLLQLPVHDVANDRGCQQAEQLEHTEDGGVEANWGGRAAVSWGGSWQRPGAVPDKV